MNKIIIGIFISALIIPGCAINKIATMSIDERHDVFQEVAQKEPVSAGQAELTITASLKTRKQQDLIWSKTTHGTPEYTLLLNIDGQTTRVRGNLTEEKTKSGEPWNPEAGEGVRYFFQIKLRISPGPHKVFVALPEDGAYLDREITLLEGTDNILNLTPVYGKRKVGRLPDLNAPTSFYEGIRVFKGYFNRKEI